MGIINNTRAFVDRVKANQSPMPNAGMQPNAISPSAFSNQGAIQSVFGQANPGTFTRSVGAAPLMQMTSQGYIPPMDPTNPTQQNDVNAVMAEVGDVGQGYNQPVPPPYGVQTPITPNYDLNGQ